MEEPEVAAARIRELLLNSIDPLFNARHPGCKKNGKFSSANVTRANISRAVEPLFASTAIVLSGEKRAYQRM